MDNTHDININTINSINDNMQYAANKLSEMLNDFGNDQPNFEEYIPNDDSEDDIIFNENDIINIDDYVLAEEEHEFGEFTNLINIFTCYFKQLFEKNQNSTVVDGFDYEKEDLEGRCLSTNKCLEFMYEEIFKFNKSSDEDKDDLYDPDSDLINIDNCSELYTLYIDGNPKFVCKFILPILHHLASIKWNDINWSIIKIKG